ncbi:hypothetical protein ACLMAJ_29740 [Nocardia sp. KC 131]|uniref:hypothetical protein n=1 Tax=Nocardia arseniciresistens TaxID=3392119 RepID=UPI00398F67A4
MSVDMYEYRFRQELDKVDKFEPKETRDPHVWPRAGSKEGEFPAWRALFSARLLHGHSTGYRLFSHEEFFMFCEQSYTKHHPEPERFADYFKGDLRAGMHQRVGVWYESGMAETYLYVCLVEALEDKAQVGMVLYDTRVDWKLKSDIVVHIKGRHTIRVNAHVGPSEERPNIERRRDGIERMRKQNTSDSAHWGNKALADMPVFEISITDDDLQVINGCRVFSMTAINRLLNQMYVHAEVTGDKRWVFPLSRPR